MLDRIARLAARQTVPVAILLFVLGLAACGGSGATPEGAAPAAATPQARPSPLAMALPLPSPAELVRSASFTDLDRIAAGWMYGDSLPQQRVSRVSVDALFAPNFPAQGGTLADVAYATYVFSVEGFSGTTIAANWSTAPAAGNAWLGLSNFKAQRWDWFAAPLGAPLSTGPLDNYIDTGSGLLYAIVLTTGEAEVSLHWLRLGDNVPPHAVLNGTPDSGDAPLSVSLDTVGSYDVDGAIATYDWDFDGDGTYDEVGTTDSAKPHVYDTAGTFNTTVRINDDAGGSSTAVKVITVTEPGRQPPVAALTANPLAGQPPLKVDFDGSASSEIGGTIVKFEWDFDGDGTYDFDSGADPTVDHTYAAVGTYQATLKVWDDINVTDSESVTISVTASNTLPTAAFIPDSYFGDAPLTVNFDASASTDSDGSITNYEWDWENDGSYDYSSATPAASYTFGAGTHTVGLRVTDNAGGQDTAVVSLTADAAGYDEVEDNEPFTAANQLPPLDFSGWDANLKTYDDDTEDFYKFAVEQPSRVTLHMICSYALADLDMSLLKDNGDGTTTILKSSTSVDDDEEIIYSFQEPGVYYWRCYLYARGPSDYTLWAKWEPLGAPPTAVIQAVPTVGANPLTVDFDGSGSTDDSGTISKWEWDLDGNGTYESSSTTVPTISATYYRAGSYTATLRVTDIDDMTDTDAITITVNSAGYDEVENNDDAAGANVLPAMPFTGFLADLGHDGYDGDDADWYSFNLAQAGTIDITMVLYDPFGDLDMKLYASDGTTEEGSSTGTDNDENINVSIPAGLHYVKCYTYNPSSGNYGGYALSASFTP